MPSDPGGDEHARDAPPAFDREFSYESCFENQEIEQSKYAIPLNIANNPTLTHEKRKMNRQVRLDIAPGRTKILRGRYYKGNVKMKLVGIWKTGMKEAIWVAIDLDRKRALEIYLDRMKIEESFKDLRSLLDLETITSKDH